MIDRIIAWRFLGRILATVFGFFLLIFIVESLDSGRFGRIAARSGDGAAWLATFVATARWSIKTLPATALIGSALGLLSLQAHREFVVMKAAGLSIWQLLRGPMVVVIVIGLLVSFAFEPAVNSAIRAINPTSPGEGAGIAAPKSGIWLNQSNETGTFVLAAKSSRQENSILTEVTIYPGGEADFMRIEAASAELIDGGWLMDEVLIHHPDGTQSERAQFQLPTFSSVADLNLQLGSVEDLSIYRLYEARGRDVNDTLVMAGIDTRFHRILALPLMLVGSLLISFAFTAGYRRMNNYGLALVYGIVLGFVVFVVSELASRAGAANVIDAKYAAWGPALMSTLIGLSLLLRMEDGRR